MSTQEDQIANSKSLFVQNLVSQYGLQIARYLLPFVTLPYLARVLSADGYGVRAYVLALMAIVVTILDFGFMQTATKHVNEHRSNAREVSYIVGAVMEAKSFLLLFVGVGLVFACMFIPLLGENVAYVAIAFIATAVSSCAPDFVFMGYERMKTITTRYIASKMVGVVLTFILIHSQEDLLLVPVIDVITSLIAVAWTLVGMIRHFGVGVRFPRLSEGVRELKSSAVVAVSNLSSTLFNSFTTLALGVIFVNPVDVALWSMSSTIISTIQSLWSPIYNSLFSYMVSRRDLSHYKKVLQKGGAFAFVVSVAVAVFSFPLMWLLGGDDFSQGSYLVAYMSPTIFFSFFSLMVGWPLLGVFGFEKEVTSTTLIAGIFSIVSVSAVGLAGVDVLAVYAVLRGLTELLLAGTRMGFAFAHRKTIRATAQIFTKEGNSG